MVKLSTIKTLICIILFIVINLHISLIILRYFDNDKTLSHNDNKYSSLINRQNTLKVLENVENSILQEVDSIFGNNKQTTIEDNSNSNSNYKSINKQDKSSLSKNKKNYIVDSNSYEHIPSLPQFALDDSEFIFSSMIEREFDSWNLYITTFMVCHMMFNPSSGPIGPDKVHPALKDRWKNLMKKFHDTKYYPSGERIVNNYYCRISNTLNGNVYNVQGSFMPNRLTSDSNANRRLDIFRCKMNNINNEFKDLIRSNHAVHVTIINNNSTVVNFTIPWNSRSTGYLLNSPPSIGKFDVWKGYDADLSLMSNPKFIPNTKGEAVYVCVSGVRQLPSKRALPVILEFVSHHLKIGVDHIYLPISVGWSSDHMKRFIAVFQSYIDEGRVSVYSQAGDSLDMIYSIGGLSWPRNTIKIFQANTCLYRAKGAAEHMLYLDIDEFFIPKLPFNNIVDVIKAQYSTTPLKLESVDLSELKENWEGGRGWADKDAHPFCYLMLTAEVFTNKKAGGYIDPYNPWIGSRFSHGPESGPNKRVARYEYPKSILPTRTMWQSGLGMGGACQLPVEWTSCKRDFKGISHQLVDNFCKYKDETVRRMGQLRNGEFIDFRDTHDFGEVVVNFDARKIDPSNATIFHFLIFHDQYGALLDSVKSQSEYTTRFFPAVLEDIKERGLELLVTIPDVITIPTTSEDQWGKMITDADIKESMAYEAMKVEIDAPVFKLKNNFAGRETQVEVDLPNFAIDYSEYAIAALIERESDSYDLYLTTFFLCHPLLEPKQGGASAVGAEKVSPEVHDVWKKAMVHFEQTRYWENGKRESPPHYYCKITHANGWETYTVEGHFIPTKLTPDSNSNKRLDIFRCIMKDTEKAYLQLARSKEKVLVEIIRDQTSLMSFRVPWSTRMTGYMFDPPPEASIFDSWKGFNKDTPGIWTHDNLYMCVPGWETPPSKQSLPLYLEFIQHHLSLGVDHFFFGILFGYDSIHMKTILRVLESYIHEDKVSVVSTAGDGFDLVYSSGGLMWGRDNVKNFHVNLCTYFSKGVADYIGVWDFDEHFIPLGTNNNILDVIRAMEAPEPIKYFHAPNVKNYDLYPQWKGGPGLADMDGHPWCYLILLSAVTLFEQAHTSVDQQHPWIGERFAHGAEPLGHGLGFKKSIRPTRTIFQGGLHMAGACRLDWPWNGCKENVSFCWGPNEASQYRLTALPNGTAINFNLNHRFDEVVLDQDAKLIDPVHEAVINHLQYHRFWFGASEEALAKDSEYTNRFFPSVIKAIDERGLEMPMVLPEKASKPFPEPDYSWKSVTDIHSELGNLSSSARSKLQKQVRTDADPYIILPQLAKDFSEFFVASMIERVSDSFSLYLTTFMISHTMLSRQDDNGNRARNVNMTAIDKWKKAILNFGSATYDPDGVRTKKPLYYCKISNYNGAASYTVVGEWVPNKMSQDFNANGRLEIFRCKLDDTEHAYMELITSGEQISVEILREKVSLISFRIPWKTRVNGKWLESPDGYSTIDPWKGFNSSSPGEWSHDKVYLCSPGLEAAPSKRNLPIVLEFIQHHLLMGISHIFVTSYFSWDSEHANRYKKILRSYIQEGTLSMTTSAADGVDTLYSTDGISWNRDSAKIIQVNLCTYFSKGMADYVGIWDYDEFFIPKGNNKNIVDLVNALDVAPNKPLKPEGPDGVDLIDLKTKWKGGKGYADGDAHPLCFIQFQSKVVASEVENYSFDPNRPWIGLHMAHDIEKIDSRVHNQFSFKKQIIPTRTMFMMGLHMSGACKLNNEWNGCNDPKVEYCSNPDTAMVPEFTEHAKTIRLSHKFDERVISEDAKLVLDNEAQLYHYMAFRYYHAIQNKEVLNIKNDYSLYYFNQTLSGLRKRNLDLLIELPEVSTKFVTADQKWTNYDLVWESRKQKGSLFPGILLLLLLVVIIILVVVIIIIVLFVVIIVVVVVIIILVVVIIIIILVVIVIILFVVIIFYYYYHIN